MRRAINPVFRKSGKFSFSTAQLEKLPDLSIESQISEIVKLQDKATFTKGVAELWRKKSQTALQRSRDKYSFISPNELGKLSHPVPRMIAEIFQDIPEQDSLPNPISNLLKFSSNLFGSNYEYLGNHAFLDIFLKKGYTTLAYSCYETIISLNLPIEQALTERLIYQLASNNQTTLIKEFLKKHPFTLNIMLRTCEPFILSGNLSFYKYLMKKYLMQQQQTSSPSSPPLYPLAEILKVLMISIARRSFSFYRWTKSEENALLSINKMVSEYFVDYPPKDINDVMEQVEQKLSTASPDFQKQYMILKTLQNLFPSHHSNREQGLSNEDDEIDDISSRIPSVPFELDIERLRDGQVIVALFLCLTEMKSNEPRLKAFHKIMAAFIHEVQQQPLDELAGNNSHLPIPLPSSSLYSYPFIGEIPPPGPEPVKKSQRIEDLTREITKLNQHSQKQSLPLFSAQLFPPEVFLYQHFGARYFVQFLREYLRTETDLTEDEVDSTKQVTDLDSEAAVDDDEEEIDRVALNDDGVLKSFDKDFQRKAGGIREQAMLHARRVLEEEFEDYDDSSDQDDEEDDEEDSSMDRKEVKGEDDSSEDDSIESVDGSENIDQDKLDAVELDEVNSDNYSGEPGLVRIVFDSSRSQKMKEIKEDDFAVEDLSSELYRMGQNRLKYSGRLFEDIPMKFVPDVLANNAQEDVKKEEQTKPNLENENDKDATATPSIKKGVHESTSQSQVETFKKDV
eukprot:gene3697-3951_t